MKQLILPEYIVLGDTYYRYGIWKCAFYESKQIFDSDNSVVELVLPASLTAIANNAFKNSHFKNYIFQNAYPPIINSEAFTKIKDLSALAPAHLYCPKGAIMLYKQALQYVNGWSGLEDDKKTIRLLEMNESISDSTIPPLYLAGTNKETSVWNANLIKISDTAYLGATDLTIDTTLYEAQGHSAYQYSGDDTQTIFSNVSDQQGYIYQGQTEPYVSADIQGNVQTLAFNGCEFAPYTALQLYGTRIESLGFYNCKNITGIVLKTHPEYIAPDAFRGVDKNQLNSIYNGYNVNAYPQTIVALSVKGSPASPTNQRDVLVDTVNKKLITYTSSHPFVYSGEPWDNWIPIYSILQSVCNTHYIPAYQCDHDLNMTAIMLNGYFITNVGYKAFYGCNNLSAIYFKGDTNYRQIISFDDYAFVQCSNSIQLINPPENLNYSSLSFDTEPTKTYDYSKSTRYKMSRWEFIAHKIHGQDKFYIYRTKFGIPIPTGTHKISLYNLQDINTNTLGIDNVIVGTAITPNTPCTDNNLIWTLSDSSERPGIEIINNTNDIQYVHIGLVNSGDGFDVNVDNTADIFDLTEKVRVIITRVNP